MNTYANLPKKKLYIISILCFLLVISVSVETAMRVKDREMFESFLKNQEILIKGETDLEILYSNYLMVNLSKFFFKIMAPLFLSLHIYYTYRHIKINSLFIHVWVITLLGSLWYIIFEKEFYSVFYYIDIFLYIALIINILLFKRVLNKEEKRDGGNI